MTPPKSSPAASAATGTGPEAVSAGFNASAPASGRPRCKYCQQPIDEDDDLDIWFHVATERPECAHIPTYVVTYAAPE